MIIFWLIVLTVIFAALHSILARLAIKSRIRSAIGERRYEGLYRIAYNILAVVTFAPVLVVLWLEPGAAVWDVGGVAAVVFRVLQLVGVVGLSVSLLQIEGGRFLGTAQLSAYLQGEPLPLPDEPLKTDGVYGLVRHPLYFFSLLVLWFTPQMQLNWLVFVILATVYFLVGSRLEERTMQELFGQAYREYQQRVPWMIPFVKIG